MLSRVSAPPILLSADISQLTGDARRLTFWRRIAPPQLKRKASCRFMDSRQSLGSRGSQCGCQIRTARVHAPPACGHQRRFRLHSRRGGIAGGGILNRGAEVVGLSNLFGSKLDLVYRSLTAMAGEIFPGLPSKE